MGGRATHGAGFFLLSKVSRSRSSTVAARRPATEPMTTTVFLWRKRRSSRHGSVLFRASVWEDAGTPSSGRGLTGSSVVVEARPSGSTTRRWDEGERGECC